MVTAKGKLLVGLDVAGVLHKDFVLRAATINDAITAIEKSGNTTSNLRLRIYKAAEQLVSLGTLTKEEITADLLLNLSEDDIEPIFAVQDEVEKKPKSSKSKPSPSSS